MGTAPEGPDGSVSAANASGHHGQWKSGNGQWDTTHCQLPIAYCLAWIVAIACIVSVWTSADDHALYSPDEGRYATVSAAMVQSPDWHGWLVPHFEGRPHLTKPPLTYWLMAGSMAALGHNELAARLPSLLATSLVVVMTVMWAARVAGPVAAATTCGTLGMMPLFVLMGRLATSDALLNLWWSAALFSGYAAVSTPQRRWPLIFWAAIAMGLFTKGPIALTPLALIVLWLAIAGRLRELGRLRPLAGGLLAAAPLCAWAAAVMWDQPDAAAVWRHEMLARATGSGAHPEPIWYYLPVFLIGLFPVTCMLIIPGWNRTWSATAGILRSGSLPGLMALATVVPLLLFSLISGKLPSYLLPLCAPMAVLNGLMLERWLRGARRAGDPLIMSVLTIVVLIVTLAAFVGVLMLERPQGLNGWPLFIAPAACAWAWYVDRRRPQWRAAALVAVFASWMVVWSWLFDAEDAIRADQSAGTLVARVRDAVGDASPRLYAWGFRDTCVEFYNHRKLESVARPGDVPRASGGHPTVLLADARTARANPAQLVGFEELFTWERQYGRPVLVMRRRMPGPPLAERREWGPPATQADAAASESDGL